MIDLSYTLDPASLRAAQRQLGLLEKQVEAAARRVIRKAGRWVQTQVSREASRELRITQRLLRGRLRQYARQSGLQQKVWVGLRGMPAERLGAVVRSGRGVRAGRHFFEGGFQSRGRGAVLARVGRRRLPLERQVLDIARAGAQALEHAGDGVERRLAELMRQELRYELVRAASRG